ncbi:MAG: purine-nucleoside phosphorylase [Peptoniphilus sp.]|nr:purine-nucleoside phosphorylase [Peptoniphilus sp.]MDD7362918.1 purine-nucleoside phosphorylase [Bacillota bacterium]MDY6044158.1 purine-nucleoside phosphorylase [Peptoniphilus sp.]
MNQTINYIRTKTDLKPEIGIILGSGLGDFADTVEDAVRIPYGEIPGFNQSTVQGHSGELIFGIVKGKKIVAMKGRIHFYEGFDIKEVVFPVKVLCDLGIDKLIVTNAAGGVNKSFNPGELMFISDHINFNGKNPLIGPNEDVGDRFPDMSYAYDPALLEEVQKIAERLDIAHRTGVYMYMTGPSYETPAEIRMAGILGADAVGMSTVPEVIVANHRHVKVVGISCITNMAAGILDQPLEHEEVLTISQKVSEDFKKLVASIIEEI